MQPARSTARAFLIACSLLTVAGCGYKERAAEELQPARMYEKAHSLLMGGDYRGAVRYYEALDARFPFSEEARQARLKIVTADERHGCHRQLEAGWPGRVVSSGGEAR